MPVGLQWEDITVEVQVKQKDAPPWKPKVPKKILKGITGCVMPGQLCAIMGPSGGGKTTLLDTLSGRRKYTSGTVLVNGKRGVDTKGIAGYVVQDDILSGWLTVRENLKFSADLRLTDAEKPHAAQQVQRVLDEVGLTRVAEQKIGNELIRGVSGGERKRANIGMELLRRPPVLFLDEPTTGLDSTTAASIVSLLRRLTRQGKTVIMAIHQPKAKIFKMFDHLIFVSEGNVLYQGPPLDAVAYFAKVGFTLEDTFENPADHIMDVAIHNCAQPTPTTEKHQSMQITGEKTSLLSKDTTLSLLEEAEEFSKWPKPGELDLAHIYKQSELYQTVRKQISTVKDSSTTDDLTALEQQRYMSGIWRELWVLSRRNILSIIRNPMVTVVQVVIMIVFAVIVGLIYLKLNHTTEGLQNRVGAIFFIIMNMVFGNLSAVEIFLKERTVFIHERASAYYRVLSYLISKMFMDVVPLRIIPTFIFGLVVYFMVGFRSGWQHFLTFELGLILTSLSSASICFMVSSGVSLFAIGNLLISLFYVFFMVFGGLMININSIPVYFRWLEKISIFRYSYASLCINELHDAGVFACPKNAPPGCQPLTGDDFLHAQDFKPDMLYWNLLILGGMTLFYFVMAYIVLLFQKLK